MRNLDDLRVNVGPGLVALLPGVWAICFGIGTFSSRPYLPRTSVLVACFYLAAGSLLWWPVFQDPPHHLSNAARLARWVTSSPDRQAAWLDFSVKGEGTEPDQGVEQLEGLRPGNQ